MSRIGISLFAVALSSTLVGQSPAFVVFGSGCPGSLPASQLSLMTPPVQAGTMSYDIDHLPVDAAVVLTGLSRTNSSLGALPLDGAAYGAPGCFLRVSPDASALVLGAGNQATYSLAIPPGVGLIGVRLFQQALVLDPAANAAGAVTSEAVEFVIGLAGWPFGVRPIANMVPIPAGSFAMGSNSGSGSPYFSFAWERPVHTVTISRPFWIAKYEVTQAQYLAVMGVNPAFFQGSAYPSAPMRPVEQVSWSDAMAFCSTLTASESTAGNIPAGWRYRLPTEAEWEYCCRAGTTTEFSYGAGLLCSDERFRYSWHSVQFCGSTETVVVGSYPPNPWGLHDMHGNVLEWCMDAWDGVTPNYPANPVTDPYVGIGPNRIRRGGSWGARSDGCRSAYRETGATDSFMGFRIVLAPWPL
ncbi:MAG: formylglycine-generating enzyme family protein [bacterium]|nr:formylglycine-generating enzyme family protein [bacterium]